jgi:hypothetical protein
MAVLACMHGIFYSQHCNPVNLLAAVRSGLPKRA